MASKKSANKLVKFCRIFQWIEAKDAVLGAAIRALCMEGALSGGRRSGATFLYPPEKVRKRIVKDAYSADAEQAITLLEAHIIPESVRTAADFRRGVGTRLGIQLEVESASGSSVTLKNGAKLEVAGDFHPLRKDNIAVWLVESGEVPLEGPEYQAPKRGRGEHVGGGPPAAAPAPLSSRQTLASNVEAAFDTCMRADKCRTRDPYLDHAVSLLNFLQANHPGLLVAVLPMIDRDPAVTFYLLVEPYKTAGADRVLDESVLFGPRGWNGAQIYEGAVSEFEGFFEALEKQEAPSAEDRSSGDPVVPFVFRGPTFVRSAVDNVRLQILGTDGRNGNKVRTPSAVHAVYEVLVAQNAIAGAQPILPDDTIRLLPGSKKLWQDELRFMLHAAMQEMRGEPVYNRGTFAEIVRMLRFQRPGNDYSSEAALSNLGMLRQNVAPQAEYMLLVKFVNSTDFLYIPVGAAKVGGAWGDIPTTETMFDPRDLSIYNAEASKARLLAGYKAAGLDRPRPLGMGTITQIRHYVALHGHFPPELGIVEAVRQ
jgi:hypothetical protein